MSLPKITKEVIKFSLISKFPSFLGSTTSTRVWSPPRIPMVSPTTIRPSISSLDSESSSELPSSLDSSLVPPKNKENEILKCRLQFHRRTRKMHRKFRYFSWSGTINLNIQASFWSWSSWTKLESRSTTRTEITLKSLETTTSPRGWE